MEENKNKTQARKVILAIVCGSVVSSASTLWRLDNKSMLAYLLFFVISLFPIVLLYSLASFLTSSGRDIENSKFFVIIVLGLILFGYLFLVISGGAGD